MKTRSDQHEQGQDDTERDQETTGSSPPSDTTKYTAKIGGGHDRSLIRLVLQAEAEAGVDVGLLSRESIGENPSQPAQLGEQGSDVGAGEPVWPPDRRQPLRLRHPCRPRTTVGRREW